MPKIDGLLAYLKSTKVNSRRRSTELSHADSTERKLRGDFREEQFSKKYDIGPKFKLVRSSPSTIRLEKAHKVRISALPPTQNTRALQPFQIYPCVS